VEEGAFPGKGVTLYRRSVQPAGPSWAHLGVLHGYGDHSGRHLLFMRWLAERGVACHALDFRGHGMSGGRRGFVSQWEDFLADLDSFLRLEPLSPERRSGRPLFLLAQSHGALVVTAAALRGLPDCAGCVFTSPYFRSKMAVPASKVLLARLANPVAPWLRVGSGILDEWMSADEELVRESRDDSLILRTATPRWYLSTLRIQVELLRQAPEFRLPLLVLMGDADPVADPRAAHDFYLGAGSPDKTFRLYPDHLHELLREAGRETVFSHIHQWLQERAVVSSQ
jgi:alpha-beta hydrolase superfamily lysophospholipase